MAISFGTLLVVGAILSLIDRSWWPDVLAAGVHAAGTLAIASIVIPLTMETEHAPPEGTARGGGGRRQPGPPAEREAGGRHR